MLHSTIALYKLQSQSEKDINVISSREWTAYSSTLEWQLNDVHSWLLHLVTREME